MGLTNWQLFFQDLQNGVTDQPIDINEVLTLVRTVYETETAIERGESAVGGIMLADNPVAMWLMNDAAGSTVAFDEMAKICHAAYPGTLVGGVTPGSSPGAFSDGLTCAAFDGSTGYYSVSSGMSVVTSLGACSFEAWIYDTTVGALSDYRSIFALNFGTDIFMMTSARMLQLSLNLSSGQKNIAGNAVLVQNQWNHVVATFDGSNVITLYINGSQDKQQTGLAGTLTSVPSVTRYIGDDGNGVAARRWKGYMQAVAVYNYALTSAQVAAHYAARTGTFTYAEATAPETRTGVARAGYAQVG